MTRTEMMQEIMAAVRTDCKAIFEAVEAAPAGKQLAAVEFEVRRLGLRAYSRILQAALLLVSGEARPRCSAPVCDCGRRMRMVTRQARTVVTVVGPLTFSRRYYSCDGCGRKRVPFDETVGLDGGAFSEGARRLISRCGSVESFRQAAGALKELAEIRVSHQGVREVTESVGEEVRSAQAAGSFCGEEAPLKVRTERGSSRAYVSADGTMVNTDKGWREAKIGAFYTQGKDQQHYVATLSEAASFGMEMRRHADAVGALGARQRVVIGDGAAWIWKMAREQFPGSVEVVDYYHLSEQVWTCARALYGERTRQGTAWASRRLREIREAGPKRMLTRLRNAKRRRRTREEQAAVETLLGYVVERQDRLRYPTFRAMGLDIGSGPVESACRHVVGKRLKGGGMRWRTGNAEVMLRLRALTASTGAWCAFWQRHRDAA